MVEVAPATVPPEAFGVVVVVVGPRIGEIARGRRYGGGGGGGIFVGTGGALVDVALDAASIIVEDNDADAVDGPLLETLLRFSVTSTERLFVPTVSRRSFLGDGGGGSRVVGGRC